MYKVGRRACNGAKTIYILFNNDYYTYAIENAASLRKLIKKPAD
jgi:uncharacterized protein YecE (DUF72 family)